MSPFTESQLESLKTHLLPFGEEWTRRTGRRLATVRDGLDFLSAMRNREDFWALLATHTETETPSLDLGALRLALPTGTLPSDSAAEAHLRSIGLTEDELRAVVSGLDEPDFFDVAIRAAFAEERPQSVARALERILSTNSDILATQCYVSRLSGSRGVARAVSATMGIALLLVGAGCPPTAAPTAARPASPVQTAPAPTPEPTPEPTPVAVVPVPEPVDAGTTPTPEPAADPPPRPPPRPHRPTPPVARYKGVSPRRRRPAAPSKPESLA
jgi:hypothetical protein